MGDLPMAGRFLLCTIGDTERRARLPDDARGYGLAAALLGELMMAGRIDITDAHVVLTAPRHASQPLVGAARRTLSLLVDNPSTRFVQDLLVMLSGDAYDAVCSDLVARKKMSHIERRRRFRAPLITLVPSGLNDAYCEVLLLGNRLERGETEEQDLLLAGLLGACGLQQILLEGRPGGAAASLEQRIAALSTGALELVQHTERVIAKSVLIP